MSLLRHHSLLKGSLPLALPTLAQSKNSFANASSSYVYSFTSTPTDGDLLVIVGMTAQAKTQTISGGWTVLATNSSQIYVWWKIAASEPASYTISISGSFNALAHGMVFRGYNTRNPISVVGSGVVTVASATTVTVPSAQQTIRKYSYAVASDSCDLVVAASSYSNSFTVLMDNGRGDTIKREYTDNALSQDTTFTYPSASGHNAVMFVVNPVLK